MPDAIARRKRGLQRELRGLLAVEAVHGTILAVGVGYIRNGRMLPVLAVALLSHLALAVRTAAGVRSIYGELRACTAPHEPGVARHHPYRSPPQS